METVLMCFPKERIVLKEETLAITDARRGSQIIFNFLPRTMKEVVRKEPRHWKQQVSWSLPQ